MSKAKHRYLLARRLPALSPLLAFQATHPAREGQFRIDVLSGLETDAQQAYLREQRQLAELGHPHLLPLVETTALPDGTPVCVSRWPEGTTLEARLISGPPLRPEQVHAIVVALEDALAAAHARGIGHGAVRADQVLLSTEDGRGAWAWLFGFGTRLLLGQAPDPDADRVRDHTALGVLAARMRVQSAAAAAPAPVKPVGRPPAAPPRRFRHWVGLGVGATVGAALTAVLTLTWQPSTARPPVTQQRPPAPPAPVAVERPAPVERAPVAPERTAPAAVEPPAPAAVEPAAPVAAEPTAAAAAEAASPPPVVKAPSPTPTPARPRPRPAAQPAEVRRGLVWSAREQRLIRVDEQGLPVEQPAAAPAAPPPASPPAGAPPVPSETPPAPPAAPPAPIAAPPAPAPEGTPQ